LYQEKNLTVEMRSTIYVCSGVIQESHYPNSSINKKCTITSASPSITKTKENI